MDASETYIEEFFGGCDKILLLELAKSQAKVLVPRAEYYFDACCDLAPLLRR